MTNPYAPPQAAVLDIADPRALTVPAERLTRLGAAILDGIIFGVMVYLPLFMTVGAAAAVGEEGAGPIVFIGFGLTIVGLIAWIWLTVLYVQRNGQSIAKKITGIKVVRTDGSPISLGRIFWLRNVVNSLISIVPLYGLIDVLFIFGETQQCLHDKIADTIVIKD
jgi:uncharacterized RDD family membrane protein YckC